MALFFKLVAISRSPAVLPDDGIVKRLAGLPVPQDGGFPLVGYPYSSNLVRFYVVFAQRFGEDGDLRGPYFYRVMFHPSGLGEFLLEILLGNGFYFSFFIKNNGSGAGRALVQSQYILLVSAHGFG